jgi:hypothetical protein
VSTETYLSGFGKPLSAREYGEHVSTVLTDAAYENALALTIRGDAGIRSIDA